MKNKNLNMLVRASISSEKLSASFFCFFITLSTILILLSVSIILPLRDNIVNKVNNHVSNRELGIQFRKNYSDNYIKDALSQIKAVDHVSEVYPMPSALGVSEESGKLFDEHTMGFVHKDSVPIITSGRALDENKQGTAIVPQTMRDFNEEDNKIYKISGEDLIGKTLVLTDECDNTIKVKVVGAYSTADPIFSGDEILVPRKDLLKYDQAVLNDASQGGASITDDKCYIVLIDSPKNVENVMEEILGAGQVYQNTIGIDADSYNVALYILLGSLAFFIILVIVGFYMFLKNNISNRTNELALYRSLGYKSKHILYIIFAEHLFFGVLSLAAGVIITELLNTFLVNPYVYTLVGNTLMEMTVRVTAPQVICVFLLFIVILLAVCRNAVVRSEKTDLTVLLRER